MSNLTTVALGRWISCLLLVLGMLMIVPEAEAQRRRGSTSRGESSRAERSKEAKKPQQANRSKQKASRPSRSRNTGSARSNRTSPRTRAPKATPRRSESRTRSTQRARTQKNTPRAQRKNQTRSKQRPRQSQSTRDRKAKTRDRSVKTDRSRERTRQSRTTPKARSERGTPKTRSGRQGDRVERGRNGNGRSTTRGDSQTRTRRGGNDDGRINGGRATRKNSRTKARTPRDKQRGQTRDGTVRREQGKSTSPRGQRGDRTKGRRGDRTRTEGQRGNRTRTEGRRDNRTRTESRRGNRVKKRSDVRKRRKVRYTERNRWKRRYERDRRYQRRHYKRRYHRKKRYRPFVIRPYIHVDIHWPWVHRHHHGWRPKYVYKQVIYVDAGWGHSGHRRSQIDVRTHYYHELRSATDNRANIDIYIERLELYENGRYIGEITHIPERLGRIRATVYRNGEVQFDRNVFVVGNTYTGFEMISTRYYDGYLLDSYRRGHGMRVAVLDLNRRRAVSASHSYLFDPYNFDGHVPVSLLPEDTGWLLDYGNASFSANYYDHDPYYYGGYKEYGDEYEDPYYGDDYYEEEYYEDDAGRPYYSVRSTIAEGNFDIAAQSKTYNQNYKTSFGAQVKVKRETEFVRVK